MTISKRGAGLLVIWLLWLGYLALTDTGAFWISLVFVPVFGAITWPAIRSRNIVLQAFAVLMFIAQAIGAPLFWLNRSNYGRSGFGSVGSFQFDLGGRALLGAGMEHPKNGYLPLAQAWNCVAVVTADTNYGSGAHVT